MDGTIRYPAARLLHYLECFYAGGAGIFVVVRLMQDGVALGLAQGESVALALTRTLSR
ncbi:hypothetical protein D3C84_1049190 [compost metagenome]